MVPDFALPNNGKGMSFRDKIQVRCIRINGSDARSVITKLFQNGEINDREREKLRKHLKESETSLELSSKKEKQVSVAQKISLSLFLSLMPMY